MDGPPEIFPQLADELQLTAQANAIGERVVRTLRRECLDHVRPLSEQHLRAVLAEFVSYYNQDRPHRSLGLETPEVRRRLVDGEVVSRPILRSITRRTSHQSAS